jgi:hypothetical protein
MKNYSTARLSLIPNYPSSDEETLRNNLRFRLFRYGPFAVSAIRITTLFCDNGLVMITAIQALRHGEKQGLCRMGNMLILKEIFCKKKICRERKGEETEGMFQ